MGNVNEKENEIGPICEDAQSVSGTLANGRTAIVAKTVTGKAPADVRSTDIRENAHNGQPVPEKRQ